MKHIHILQIVPQIFPFFGSQNTHGQADQGPQMDRVISTVEMIAQIVNLGMAVVAGGDAILSTGCFDLIQFQPAIFMTGLGVSGLQITASAPAAIVVGPVGLHVDEVVFTHHRPDHKPQIFRNGVTKTLANKLTGVLNREFDFPVCVPCRVDREFAFPNPLGVILDDASNFKFRRDVEFLQSVPDRE